MTSRRNFLQHAALGAAGVLLAPLAGLHVCRPGTARSHIRGSLHGANHATGHLLREPGRLPAPTRTQRVDVLIVGGGVAGLAARRELARRGFGPEQVLLVELDEQPGGNSSAGRNAVASYPWGAHYLPVPDPRNHALLAFLQEAGVVTGTDAASGLPIYNDYYLCHDPEERLYLRGHWQSGLVPELGVPAAEKVQIARFFRLIEEMRAARGTDGREAFRIPLAESSADARFRVLDEVTFAAYLDEHGFTGPHLRWYLDYCCRDDYGAPAAQVSAWAGLHYFASRKGRAHNASAADVLTWPAGNGFLVEQLRRQASSPIHTNTVAYALHDTPTGLAADCYDVVTRQTTRVEARQILLATPWFVTERLLAGLPEAPKPALAVHRAPWVVVNLTVDGLPQGPGQPLSWDNVLFGTESVGYVNASHQSLSLDAGGPKVITYYLPLPAADPVAARRLAYQTSYDEWVRRALAELETAHPGLTPHVQRADVWVWGHGMATPTPGLLWGAARQQAARPWQGKLFFAHTDLSGMSIFEEGFYQGCRAAAELASVRRA
ncbi:NAD(P)/FAD-dependent oxidoreductase [Hymenobacter weizhouensis]|uniref:NAD(P)/FAD-dependent oxidoreductase n=1 Tax=Hymenobacter sp. YIM 151500-1 TaxID=2987689 RepID=UPI002226E4BE|nr:NAD(P)/FAD-dependent oxidoreductase [Hymenobacter sp. YIM 151500-1]UYZ64965.1 NAD(P)/FAD-dependent oxidoreductase [Hymenobacter sp. YIM 151500-1]